MLLKQTNGSIKTKSLHPHTTNLRVTPTLVTMINKNSDNSHFSVFLAELFLSLQLELQGGPLGSCAPTCSITDAREFHAGIPAPGLEFLQQIPQIDCGADLNPSSHGGFSSGALWTAWPLYICIFFFQTGAICNRWKRWIINLELLLTSD